MSEKSLRVCYFGTYRAEYARNQILIEGLRRSGIEVLECHVPLWRGVEDRVAIARGGWKKPAFWWRLFYVYAQLVAKHASLPRYDILIVGYPGHYDVFLARLLSWWRRIPLVWDVLNSLYLITSERGIDQSSPFTVNMIRKLEGLACRLPERLILDTSNFVEWFASTHHLPASKFRLVRIGADERYFHPIESNASPDNIFRVIYYGSYIPNHGIETIIRAAHLLQDDPQIHFEMIGVGPKRSEAEKLVRELQLINLTFIDWLERPELRRHIASADVVLGVFGTSLQLALTNNNKIYEGFAMVKPVISARSPALPEMLHHKEHLYLCEPGDPHSLAEGIRTLKADPELRQHLSINGHHIFEQFFTVTQIGHQFAGHLWELVLQ